MAPVENEIFMDCLQLAFRDSSFDKIIFVAVLHHFASEMTRIKALL
jgi:ubiquinone/menaquinone biosynthesis C-methylase UbiE